jgi:hypothetical protein
MQDETTEEREEMPCLGRFALLALGLTMAAGIIGSAGYCAATAWDWQHSILFAVMWLPALILTVPFIGVPVALPCPRRRKASEIGQLKMQLEELTTPPRRE